MKKNWNIVLLILFLSLTGGLLGSCTDEIDGKNTDDGIDKVNLRVQFSTKAGDGSAATDPQKLNDNEYRIRSIRLYAFDGEILDNMVYESGLENITGEAEVQFAVKPGSNKTFYAVVNEPDIDEIHSALALANHPNGIKQVQYSINNYLKSEINALTKSGDYFLPMYKEMTNVNISKATANLSIGVDRAVARIDLYMIKANGITAEAITENASLKVERSISDGYIATDNVLSTNSTSIFEMDQAKSVTLGAYSTNYADYTKVYSFYVPEQTCEDEADRLKFTLGGITWEGKQMTDPYSSFYLGNDDTNSEGKVLTKITRNKVYQIYCRIKPTTKNVSFDVVTLPWNVVPTQIEESEKGEISMVNCYMVAPGGSVNIPVQNVYRFWAWSDDLATPDPISKEMEVVPEIIWTDTENLITSVDLLNIPNLTDNKDHARVRVQTAPGKQGNAVIGMRMKSEDGTLESGYRWSWHVWVTGYNPLYADSIFTKDGVTFMNRNLGALTDHYNAEGTVQGLIYQWGRKDPFPTKNEWFGDDIHYPQNTIKLEQVIEPFNLATAIKNPASFYFNRTDARKGDWYSSTGEQNDNLWRNNIKTVYDPCPEGWRVPSSEILIWNDRYPYTDDWDDLGDEGFTTINIGFYPFSAYRPHTSGMATYGKSNGGFWFSGIYTKNTMFGACLAYNLLQPSDTGGNQRATGKAVRCVKE